MIWRQLLGLLIISFLITNLVAYLDEGIRTFEYLTHIGDWIALLFYTSLFLSIPLIIFFLVKSEKWRFYLALTGFLPALFFILPNL